MPRLHAPPPPCRNTAPACLNQMVPNDSSVAAACTGHKIQGAAACPPIAPLHTLQRRPGACFGGGPRYTRTTKPTAIDGAPPLLCSGAPRPAVVDNGPMRGSSCERCHCHCRTGGGRRQGLRGRPKTRQGPHDPRQVASRHDHFKTSYKFKQEQNIRSDGEKTPQVQELHSTGSSQCAVNNNPACRYGKPLIN